MEITHPVWSPHSKHIAYMVQRMNRWLVVVDGKPVNTSFVGFFKDTTLHFIKLTKIQTLAVQDSPGLNIVRYDVNLP
jgi:hypothetical protein